MWSYGDTTTPLSHTYYAVVSLTSPSSSGGGHPSHTLLLMPTPGTRPPQMYHLPPSCGGHGGTINIIAPFCDYLVVPQRSEVEVRWVERGEKELPCRRREAGGVVSVATTRR